MYLTPAQFRAKDYGVGGTLTDAQLAPILSRAAADLHTYTCAPTLPVPHDFRGGTIVGETHTWRIEDYERQPTRRVFPYHRPVIEVTSMRIYATRTQYVAFDASELYYETSEGWVEPASANLTSYGLFGAAMLPFIGLSQPHSVMDYTYGSKFPTTERIYWSGTGEVWRASLGFWDVDAVVVLVDGATAGSGTYTVDRVEGTITFTSSIPSHTAAVDVTFVGTLNPAIAEAMGLIVAGRLSDKNFLATMGSLRRITVAEITLDRGQSRPGALVSSLPHEAAELLEPFIFRSVAFG